MWGSPDCMFNAGVCYQHQQAQRRVASLRQAAARRPPASPRLPQWRPLRAALAAAGTGAGRRGCLQSEAATAPKQQHNPAAQHTALASCQPPFSHSLQQCLFYWHPMPNLAP